MQSQTSSLLAYWRKVFDVVPIPMLVVDPEVHVLNYNAAAKALLGNETDIIFKRKSGELMHCVHAVEHQDGCGASAACQDCVVRQAIGAALQGAPVARKRAVLEKVEGGVSRMIQLLVTSAVFDNKGATQVLLILEDVSELTALRELLPICARCKKIRDDQRYWHQLESYCHDHLSLEFTHSVCPDCARELYGT